jgi:phospholipase/carboxylesterase
MHTTIAGLDAEVLQQQAGAPAAAVVLCHGFGAPGDDLVALHAELLRHAPALGRARFFFPAAPLALPWGNARAWWPLDVAAIQRLSGDPVALREFRKVEPPGMAAARATLRKFLDEVAVSTGLPVGKIAVGGFSQGAMITTDLALRTEERCAGLAVLSGTLLLEDVWAQKAAARAGFEVFQGHGRQDPLLPFSAAELLRDVLTTAGAKVEFLPFEGGHTITGAELLALARFLEKVTA